MSKPLSPAAQAVLDALPSAPHLQLLNRAVAAAVLRAAADQVVPDVDLHVSVATELLPKDIGAAKWSARYEARRQLLAIAAELKGYPNVQQNAML